VIYEIEFTDGSLEKFEADSGVDAMRIAEVWFARKYGKLLTEIGIFGCREVASAPEICHP